MELSVKTKTGKEYEVDHCVETMYGITPKLYIEFISTDMGDIFSTFSNKEETEILYGLVNEKVSKEYNGYTKLMEVFIVPNTDNHIRIRMEQEEKVDILGA